MYDNEPAYPLMIMNRHCINAPTRKDMLEYMPIHVFQNGRFKEKAIAIDVACRKFEVIDVLYAGRVWNPLHWSIRFRNIKVKYIYGPPEQLTFEKARSEYVELVCKRGWYSQFFENEKQFRSRISKIGNMRELLESVGYLGKWLL